VRLVVEKPNALRFALLAGGALFALLVLLGVAPDAFAADEAGAEEDEGGSFLVSPALGLMFWTLLAFGVTMWVLSKVAFPRIGEWLEKRAAAIRENIEAAERQRQEADELLAEYRARLTEAREQADDIVARARKAAEAAVAEATAEGKAKREELVAAARKDIEAETRRSLEQIRKEVADLTVLATEKVTRKTLSDADHQRLIEEALAEVDFSALAGDAANGNGGTQN
jgi:F-type H+-transporting ATPase subunit b